MRAKPGLCELGLYAEGREVGQNIGPMLLLLLMLSRDRMMMRTP